MHSIHALAVVLTLAGGAACDFDDGAEGYDRPRMPRPTGPDAGAPGLDADGFGPAPGYLRRLTVSELRATYRDLLGAGVELPTDLQPDTLLIGFSTVGAATREVGELAVGKLETAATQMVAGVFADTGKRAAHVGCTPASAADACVSGYVKRFGRRAFRRPLADDEVAAYVGLVANVAQTFKGDVWAGLKYATSTMLQSPFFVYRVEVGEDDPERTGKRRFSSHEMAGRLSYALWGTTPDDELLNAAEKGALVDATGLAAQVDRLLLSPRFGDAVDRFFDEHWHLVRLAGLGKDTNLFPDFSSTAGDSMREEMRLLVRDVLVEGDADVRSLFTTKTTFVNAELAQLYGIPTPSGGGFAKVNLPTDREGILTTGAVLAGHSPPTRTSPTSRGIFIYERMLCREVHPPPPGVDTSFGPPAPGAGPQTMRQRTEFLRTNPTCKSCHMGFDPLGLMLEGFDSAGHHRTTDQGLPLNLSGSLNGKDINGARELAEALSQSPEVANCFVKSFYRWSTGHHELGTEEPSLDATAKDFTAKGYKLRALVRATMLSKGFRYVAEPR